MRYMMCNACITSSMALNLMCSLPLVRLDTTMDGGRGNRKTRADDVWVHHVCIPDGGPDKYSPRTGVLE